MQFLHSLMNYMCLSVSSISIYCSLIYIVYYMQSSKLGYNIFK